MSLTLAELAAVLPHSSHRGDTRLTGITHDSRRVKPGWLFCAVRGSHGDGHTHVQDAVQAGAAAVMVERFVECGVPQLLVPSVRAALGPASSAVEGWPAQHLRSIGITGTDGKTTTSYLLERVLEAHGWRTGVVGTVETRIGGRGSPSTLTTPEAPDLHRTLAEMVDDHVDAAIMEVSSHGIDQQRIEGIRFDVAVFTNLFPEHLDYHGTVEHYWATKAKLFEATRAAAGVICVDQDWGVRLAHQTQVPSQTFGRSHTADLVMEQVSTSLSGTSVTIRRRGSTGTRRRLWSPLVGSYNAYNMAAAYLAARILGVPASTAEEGIASCAPVPGRFELIDRGQPFLVVVDYAHTPDALAGLLATARDLVSNRVLVVVGARGGRDRLKRPRTGRVAATADLAVLTTDSPGREDPAHIAQELLVGTVDVPGRNVVIELDRAKAITFALANAGPGDAVLVVGRGHERSRHVGDQEVPFDDRQGAADALAGLGWTTPLRTAKLGEPSLGDYGTESKMASG
ncbi:MAG: UDP-N-acetylmuramoyl-L-alanyl-D-glutamate--2,6-diaminopimelate ligase [Actinomycetota bacterium]|nr:UDP-N-acetylmuramoyl-L-alanyl-D-glutamate--2,6-diaminopimelate ligase [Actinomycetota bacterium]